MTRLADALDKIAEGYAAAAMVLRIGAETPQDAPDATQAPSFEELPFSEQWDQPVPAGDFEDTPTGRSRSGGCPVHGVPWVVKPAGTSKKTGAPYNAFWHCNEQNEDGTYCRQKPTAAWVKAHPAR